MKKLLFTAALGFLMVFANSSSLVNANLSQTKLIGSNNAVRNFNESKFNEEVVDADNEATLREVFNSGGSVRMVKDIQITSTLMVSKEVKLDLNGCVLSPIPTNKTNIITVPESMKLILNDSDRTVEHRGTIDGTGLWNYDQVGNDIISGGIITGAHCSDNYHGYAVNCNGAFEMNGGTIAGNKVLEGQSAMSAVHISKTPGDNASFVMNGGTISNNVCSCNHGGGVSVTSGASFQFNAGKITANYAKERGGGIYVSSEGSDVTSSLTMTGGIISENVVTDGSSDGFCGAGVAICSSNFTMNGGIISDNKAPKNGAGVGVFGIVSYPNSTFKMISGKITNNIITDSSYNGAGVFVGVRSDVIFGDIAYVRNNFADRKASNVYLSTKSLINLDSPNSSMSIGIDSSYIHQTDKKIQLTTNTAKEGDERYFLPDSPVCAIEYNNSKGWLELTRPDDLTITLNEDMTIKEAMVFDDPNQRVTIDLNGHALILDASNDDAIRLDKGATVTIVDSNTEGIVHEGYVDSIGLWHLGEGIGTPMTVKGGIITSVSNIDHGIAVVNSSTLVMNGGTIIGNNCCFGSSVGGSVKVESGSTFTMNGGIINYNISNSGAGVVINQSTFTMNGGKISSNKAMNGNGAGVKIENESNFNMIGGVISDNNCVYGSGAGVDVDSSDFTMSGGIISGNSTNSWYPEVCFGGGVAINSGFFRMLGGIISNNRAAVGAGLYVSTNVQVKFGGTAKIVNNFLSASTDLDSLNNVHYFGSGTTFFMDNEKEPEDGMSIGIGENVMIQNALEGYESYFFSDNKGKYVIYNGSTLHAVDIANEDRKICVEHYENGFVSVPEVAKVGDTVTVTIDQLEGYELVSLKYGDGEDYYDITDNTFVVPEARVITIKAEFDRIVSGSFLTPPTKTKYKLGEDLNLEGAKLVIAYATGEQEEVDVTSDMVSGYNKNKVGEQTVTVTYKKLTETFKVTVVDNPTPPTPPTPEDSGLSAGLIAAIVGGSVVALGGLIWLIVVLAKKKKRKDDEKPVAKVAAKPTQKAKPVSKTKSTTKKTSKKK